MATTAKKQSAEQPSAKSKAFVSESLAVKYRPKTLSEFSGHSGVVQQLMGMFKTGHVPNTILLAGESGTGKTTLARMIARTVNCQNLDQTTFAPCESCMSCRYENSHPDIMEMNMADTRGIDDVRALIAASRNSPSIGSNRVILLDESHMLTSQAAQCLPPDAEVLMVDGTYRQIKDLANLHEPAAVKGFDISTNTETDAAVVGGLTQESEGKELLEIETEHGCIQVTSDHKIWSVTRNSYVKAGDLVEGEELRLTNASSFGRFHL